MAGKSDNRTVQQDDDATGPRDFVRVATGVAAGEWEFGDLGELAIELKLLRARFAHDPNPLDAVAAMTMANKLGVYPPADVLAWVAVRFECWQLEQGKVTMDRCL